MHNTCCKCKGLQPPTSSSVGAQHLKFDETHLYRLVQVESDAQTVFLKDSLQQIVPTVVEI